ncbi:MAG: LacI family DNA-binding transcriptional regulator [Nocardioides sp.]
MSARAMLASSLGIRRQSARKVGEVPDAPRPPSRRATLRDVAIRAGVSTKTASRVVNAEPGVSEAKLTAVNHAIAELNYRRDMGASSLRRADGRTQAVGAVLEDLANPYSAEVHRALENEARERGVLIFAGSVDQDIERERQLVREFTARRADALVMMPASADHEYLATEVSPNTPVVFIDRPPHGFPTDAVLTDNAPGAATAVEHLVAHGHTRIGFLGDAMSIPTARERHRGFLDAMSRRGLRIPPTAMATGLHSDDASRSAAEAMFGVERPPTAVFTAQNNITSSVIRVLAGLGLRDQVAMVGFDDLPWADLLQPGITVMAQDPALIGRTAAEIVFARLGGDDSAPRTEIIPTRLIRRGSGELPAPR